MVTQNDLNGSADISELQPPSDGVCPMCGKQRGLNRMQWTLYPDWYSCKYCFRSKMPIKHDREKFIEEQKTKLLTLQGTRRDELSDKINAMIASFSSVKTVLTELRVGQAETQEQLNFLTAQVRKLMREEEGSKHLGNDELETLLNHPPMESLRHVPFIKDWVNRRLLVEPSQLGKKWKDKKLRPLVGCELRKRLDVDTILKFAEHDEKTAWESFISPKAYLVPSGLIHQLPAVFEGLDNDKAKKDRFVSQLSSSLALSPGTEDDKIDEALNYAPQVFMKLASVYWSLPLTLTAQDKEELGW